MAVVLVTGQPGRPQAESGDGVEEIRQLLRSATADLGHRDRALKTAAKMLTDVQSLRDALALREWRDEDPDDKIAAIDARHRAELVSRFEARVRENLQSADPAIQQAMLNLLGQIGTSIRGQGSKQNLTSAFAVDVVQLTKSTDPGTRRAAATTIGQIYPPVDVAVQRLHQLLAGADPGDRLAAAQGLWHLMKTSAQHATQGRSAAGFEIGRKELVEIGRAVVAAAGRGIRDDRPAVRQKCIETIRTAADALRKLTPSIQDYESRPDRAAYVRQIQDEHNELMPLIRGLRQQTPELTRALGDRQAAVRLVARRTMEDIAGQQLRIIERSYVSADPVRKVGDSLPPAHFVSRTVREDQVLEGLRKTIQELTVGLKDQDVKARRAAMDVLETLGPASASAVPALIDSLRDTDVFVRWSAARTLGKISPVDADTVVPALAGLLAALDLDLRLAAADALDRYGQSARLAVPELITALRSSDPEMRVAVCRTLRTISSPGADASIPALITALGDADARVRRAAAETLGKFGPAAQSAREALTAALRDRDAQVQKAAGEALLRTRKAPQGTAGAAGK